MVSSSSPLATVLSSSARRLEGEQRLFLLLEFVDSVS